ncbi:DNA-3-methyladenine glycosylase 2 [Gynuella sunshinyii]|uniref:DNA-3-methyladenine glycosylase II n=1 Tax=Gynuella sunshinyii YC6258 TaxID=1445510 RepID=A0A0C5VB73_9GAMM|nr:AlkA N-terminal domain-containing protein [Gynuella sunshinyii]AJQ96595.1 3-methyladenine DNA glycosylase/8-oxoguanine DNA glycosylase [Gynuella sunshinyii YC6258]
MPTEYRQQLTLELPDHFRIQDFLDFHRRDQQALAERVSTNSLTKGLMLSGVPCQLEIGFNADQINVQLTAAKEPDPQSNSLSALAAHMLGLSQPIQQFEQMFSDHPQVGSLLRQNKGLRIPQAASAYEALVWAIIGQQISLTAAISIRRRFIQAAGQLTLNGLYCFPDPDSVSRMDPADIKGCGFSNAKIQALMRLNEWIQATPTLPNTLTTETAKQLNEQLLSIKGIGPWTVSYALLRGFNWLDGSLHGDVAVRRNLQYLLKMETAVDARYTEQWLQPFSPWRALMAAHLWAQQSSSGY